MRIDEKEKNLKKKTARTRNNYQDHPYQSKLNTLDQIASCLPRDKTKKNVNLL
jgi:hypothetical protein